MLKFLISAWFDADRVAKWDTEHPGVYLQHLKTVVPDIKLEGLLFDRAGERCGIFALVQGKDFAEVDRWIAESPYQTAGLYTRTEVHRIAIQSGTLP